MKGQTEILLNELRLLADKERVKGMARFGISSDNTLGISVPKLKEIAKKAGKDHETALALWNSGIHEARLLAAFTETPAKVTEKQMEEWVSDFDSWDICDQVCNHVFQKTPFAYAKTTEWSEREEEFVKRASFVMMATLAVHDKKQSDAQFLKFLSIIEKKADDERNFVKKAINWALRQIGKRNKILNDAAIAAAKKIQKRDSKSARWVASDALRELSNAKILARLDKKS
jgi:3-methyladenine DNA glycosylase AlkD